MNENDIRNMDSDDNADRADMGLDPSSLDAFADQDQDEVGRLQLLLEDAEKRVLREQAELENFRRRIRREMEDERRFAIQPLLTDMLPVIDNVDRAIEASKNATDSTGLLEGFRLVAMQLETTLAKHHCTKIDALGQIFDPTRHEAIQHMPSSEYENGTVMLVAQSGYLLHDRVVRPAQVIVSKGSTPLDA